METEKIIKIMNKCLSNLGQNNMELDLLMFKLHQTGAVPSETSIAIESVKVSTWKLTLETRKAYDDLLALKTFEEEIGYSAIKKGK